MESRFVGMSEPRINPWTLNATLNLHVYGALKEVLEHGEKLTEQIGTLLKNIYTLTMHNDRSAALLEYRDADDFAEKILEQYESDGTIKKVDGKYSWTEEENIKPSVGPV